MKELDGFLERDRDRELFDLPRRKCPNERCELPRGPR